VWSGSPPLQLIIYLLEKLKCNTCDHIFVAGLPEGVQPKTLDDKHPEDPKATTRSTNSASANGIVALLRYGYGLPHYRLAQLQSLIGIPLPSSTQWGMIMQVYYSLRLVWDLILAEAAQAPLFYNDDTRMKVISLLQDDKEGLPRWSSPTSKMGGALSFT
jgi:hypothetical protein